MDVATCEQYIGQRVTVAYEGGGGLTGLLTRIERAPGMSALYLILDVDGGEAGMPVALVGTIEPVRADEQRDKRGHTPTTCANPDCPGCAFCAGGLDGCDVCNGLEGSMPSTCPGQRMTDKQIDEVYAGHLDYRDGQWVAAPSPNSPTGMTDGAA